MSSCEEHYKKSIEALENLIKNQAKLPSGKEWNKIASKSGYLTSLSIEYISGDNFRELCKKIHKELKEKSRGKNK